eukprot:9483966-Pyramimonas_sp.AAC.1
MLGARNAFLRARPVRLPSWGPEIENFRGCADQLHSVRGPRLQTKAVAAQTALVDLGQLVVLTQEPLPYRWRVAALVRTRALNTR